MNTITLKKDIRTHQLVFIAAGAMIGAGWMVMIGSWISAAGTGGAVLAFFTGLLMVLPVALCYGSLATKFPQSGGEIVYVFEAFGTLPAFAIGWLYLLICVGWSAFQIVAASWFLTILVPAFPTAVVYSILGYDVTLGFLLIALFGTLWITRVNYKGGGSSARLQEAMTVALLGGTLLLVVAGFTGADETVNEVDAAGMPAIQGGFLSLLITVPVWYSGFNVMAQALGEVGELRPGSVSKVIVGTIFGTFIFYASVLLSVSSAATPERLAAVSPALLAMFEPGAVWPPRLALCLGLLGILTTWNILFFASTRILFALSRASIISQTFSRVDSHYGAPRFAVLFVGFITLLGALSGRGVLELIVNTWGICFAIIYFSISLTYLRLAPSFSSGTPSGRAAGKWLGALALLSAVCMTCFAFLVTYRDRSHVLPLEWCILLVWIGLGFVVWRSARSTRNTVTDERRRQLIHTR